MPEGSSVTTGGHERTGSNRPNARHLLQLATVVIALLPLDNLLLHLGHVAIQFFDMRQQPSKEVPQGIQQAVLWVIQDPWDGLCRKFSLTGGSAMLFD
jgi:hypothetical protein